MLLHLRSFYYSKIHVIAVDKVSPALNESRRVETQKGLGGRQKQLSEG